MKIKKIAVHL